LLALLAEVPRDADGTVPVRRAAAALSTGPDRARRLLRTAGLLHTATNPPGGDPTTNPDHDGADRGAAPIPPTTQEVTPT
jgi:hypothetical protein